MSVTRLVWEIASDGDYAETVRISYLLRNIDRLVAYKAIADKEETKLDLKSYLVLRNFSGEDFDKARVLWITESQRKNWASITKKPSGCCF
jgi:hypothetical protein